jgi:mannose-6-phosphate isomerase-like protein (cupin superfamily)
MRTSILAAVLTTALLGLNDTIAHGQQSGQAGRGRGAAATQTPVPKAPTDKTAFWSAEDIEARWKENEALKRANSRLFDGPTDLATNWTANIRIVLDNDPPLVHEGASDLWIVTRGSAVARTDGEIAESGSTRSIRNGMQRNVKAGDVLYVPPGVPHHFTDLKEFRAYLIRFDAVGLAQTIPAAQKQPEPDLPKDKTAFWSSADVEARWKENEARQRANSRLYNGPTNISGNVRIVLNNDPPLIHEATTDLWIVTAGTAVSRTDGQAVKNGDALSIVNGVQRQVKAGDILYVPPGVPHHFTDIKGFRAYLIRFDTLGLTRAPAATQSAGTGRD